MTTRSNPTSFEGVLRLFINATKNSKKHALTLSRMALEHFASTGDVSRAQQFFDAMPQNYLRRQALVAWLVDHAPIKVEGGKFVKDRERATEMGLTGDNHVREEDMTKALETAFWDYLPEKPVVNYSIDTAQEMVIRLIGRLRSKNYKAEDKTAEAFVDRLETFVKNIPSTLKADAGNTNEAGSTDEGLTEDAA